ncbi:MAG TPA: sigma-54-dependent Fis family transcriptional regulator, partial [Firmicutes bacterium]|nr:sigma-54-dependent Fis family transcriptional regulator [Bacillota bacterium]
MAPKDEEVLKLFNDSFLSILDKINDPVIVIDKDGIVIYVNSAYEYQIGISREKILHKNLYEKYPNDKLLSVLKTGEQIKDEYYDETLGYDIVAHFIPLKDADRKVKGVIGVGNANAICKINKHLRALVVGNTGKPKRKVNRAELQAFKNIITQDPKMLHCINIAANVAKTDASVMLRGETGCGKELFAEAIHKASNRSKYPFVEINCSAIPENLLESELFGYAPGAFTGARSQGKKGKFEEAHNGTLFLDEIGDISLNTQVKLLRFTQEKYIEKLGDTKKIPVNVRIISATNRNLEQMVQQGEFRADLFYRLNVVPIFIPPLRERFIDISILASHFLNHYAKKYNKSIMLTPDAVECLQDYPWPGNVRELKNVIEHAVILCQTNKITRDDLQLNVLSTPVKPEFHTLHLNTAVEKLEKTIILEALAKANNNKSKAINYLNISR